MRRSVPSPQTLRLALATDEWFAAAPLALQDFLLATAGVRRLAAGECLFARGSAAQGLCCVLSGALHIGASNAAGETAVLARLEPYHWFGEMSLIDGLARTHDAVAQVPARVLEVPRQPLLGWLDEHPEHWRVLAQLTCRKLRTVFDVMEELAHLPLEQRLLRRLHLLARGYGSRDAPHLRVRIAQEALSQMLGVSRQSTNKALKALEVRGLVQLRYGEILLLGQPPG
jgi:CRP/FNR family transcriptional regulator, cyclic AMP receptor protein